MKNTFSPGRWCKPMALVVQLASSAALFGLWGSIPQEVPTHFGFWGQPDAFGHKSGLVMVLLMSWLLWGLLQLAGLFPALMNLPVPAESRAQAEAYGLVMLARHQLAIGCIFGWILWRSAAALPLDPLFLPMALAGVLLPLAGLLLGCKRLR